MKIYLDDERNPSTDNDWVIVRNFAELEWQVMFVRCFTPISEISFDHDLGEEKNGMDCLKFLVDLDIILKGKLFTEDFKYNFHTANPCGRDNMKSYIESYLKQKGE